MNINKQGIYNKSIYETKFLGVIIQHNLKWPAHINLIQNKIPKTVGIMSKIKNILSTPYFMPLKDLHLHYTRSSKNNLFLLNAQKSCRINSL